MTGVSMDVTIDDKEVKAAFLALQRKMGNTTPIMQAIGTGLVGNVQRRLGSGSLARNWAPLNPRYKAGKRNKNMLVESGGLRGSLSSQAGNDYAKVGTNKIYAAIHQFGGEIKAKGQNKLFFNLGSSFVATKSVTMPARPFLTIEDEDEKMVANVLFRALQMH